MKRKSKAILACFTLLCVCAGLTGCGKETVDVSADADILVSGYDGHGTATYSKGNWLMDTEETYGKGMSLMELAALEAALYDAVEYSVSPSENISNGDEVVLTIDVDNSALESYDFKLAGGEKKITVSGLEEVKAFDPFENVTVNFGGMSPNGSASVNTSDSNVDIDLSYTLDKSSGLKNGDEVTVSISSYSGTDVEEYCMSKGKIPTVTEKTFTVEGLAGYAQKLEDIPEDSLNKMISQAEDSFKSYSTSWDEGNSLKNTELLGYYFLVPKEGFSYSYNNQLYCVFKETAEVTGFASVEEAKEKDAKKKPHTVSYYTYYKYSDIVLLDDGNCSFDLSSGSMPSSTIKSKYGYMSWGELCGYTFKGYSDLDSMFNDCVTSQIDSCSYENTVKE